jgi:rubrerythrin
MKLQTASSVISLAKELEGKAAEFYQDLAKRYVQGKDAFLAFAQENKKNIVQIERAYYGVISDAIEGCYAFNLESDDYTLKTTLAKGASYSEALDTAVRMEEMVTGFYTRAAEQSKCLMADVPRAFSLVARKRGERLVRLKTLQAEQDY